MHLRDANRQRIVRHWQSLGLVVDFGRVAFVTVLEEIAKFMMRERLMGLARVPARNPWSFGT
jgi:hypothetical protein